MEVANAMVAIGGDSGSIISKGPITPSEVVVLRAIHGEDAVTNIKILGTIERRNRDERARISNLYGNAVDGNQNNVVQALFPGAAARVFETFAQLELDESFYAEESKHAGAVEAESTDILFNEPITPIDETKVEEIEKAADDDGIEEMPGNEELNGDGEASPSENNLFK